MKLHRPLAWFVGLSILAYVAWALVLRFGTPWEKLLATEAVVLSPIPPVP